jgi:hypothetical protein
MIKKSYHDIIEDAAKQIKKWPKWKRDKAKQFTERHFQNKDREHEWGT